MISIDTLRRAFAAVVLAVSFVHVHDGTLARADETAPRSRSNPVRGIHLTIHGGDAVGRLTREVIQLSRLGVNLLILEVNYSFEYRSHPELNAPGDITKAEITPLVKACKEEGIRLVPQLQCIGHQSWKQRTGRLLTKYPHFDETPGRFPKNEGIYCRSWCPKHPDLNRIVFDLFDELIEVFQADALHVGLDEIFLFASEHCKRCRGSDPGKLFAQVIAEYHGHLVKKRGVEMLLWGDRLLSMKDTGYSKWNADDKGMHEARERIPRDIVICDWNYQKRDRYPSVDLFQSSGFRVLSCGWNEVEATEALIHYSLKTRTEKYLGHVCTVWGARRPGELATWPPILAAMEKIGTLEKSTNAE